MCCQEIYIWETVREVAAPHYFTPDNKVHFFLKFVSANWQMFRCYFSLRVKIVMWSCWNLIPLVLRFII